MIKMILLLLLAVVAYKDSGLGASLAIIVIFSGVYYLNHKVWAGIIKGFTNISNK